MSGIIGGAGSKSGVIGTTELDYEEGTYTPTMTSGSGSFSSFSVNIGRYILIGKLVWVRAEFTISSLGTASGSLSFTLPFTAKNIGGTYGVFFVGLGSERAATGTILQGNYNNGTSKCTIKSYNNNNVGPANNYNYVMNMHYEID